MDGQFYNDLRAPFVIADVAQVTLSTTNLALAPIANFPAMAKDYWWAGKKVEIRAFGRITTGATPGNLTISLLYGTGAAANGVSVVASAAQTLIASQSNISWFLRFVVHCRTPGATGGLFGTGHAQFGTAVIAAGWFLLPATAPAVSASVDLTVASNVLSIQALRSGSTAETMTVHDLEYIAMN
jgi:hypothetical protein